MDDMLRELVALEALVGGAGASHAPVQHAPVVAGAGGKQATSLQVALGDDAALPEDPRRPWRPTTPPRKSQRRSLDPAVVDTKRQDADAVEADTPGATGVAEAAETGAKSAPKAVRYDDAPWKKKAAAKPLVPKPPKFPPTAAQMLPMPPTSKVPGTPPPAAPAAGEDEGRHWRPTGGRDGQGRFGARGRHANTWWFEERQKAFKQGPAAQAAFYAKYGKAKGQPLYQEPPQKKAKEPEAEAGPPMPKATHMLSASLPAPPPPPSPASWRAS